MGKVDGKGGYDGDVYGSYGITAMIYDGPMRRRWVDLCICICIYGNKKRKKNTQYTLSWLRICININIFNNQVWLVAFAYRSDYNRSNRTKRIYIHTE